MALRLALTGSPNGLPIGGMVELLCKIRGKDTVISRIDNFIERCRIMKMLRNNLLVEILTKEQRGAIKLPDCVRDDWVRGRVRGVGDGMYNENGTKNAVEIEEDDIVIFPPCMGGEYPKILVDGFEYIILSEYDVWAIENK